jgi:mRNA interferase MazF
MKLLMIYKQFDIVLVNLDPTVGSEIKKTRPCLVVSPNEMNLNIQTIIIAPITNTSKNYPTRIHIEKQLTSGWIILDQIRTIDKQRVVKHIELLNSKTIKFVKRCLVDIFS